MGKIPFESLCLTWDKSPNLKLGQRGEATLSIEVHPYQVKVFFWYFFMLITLLMVNNSMGPLTRTILLVAVAL